MLKISTLLSLLCLALASATGMAQEVKDLAVIDMQSGGTTMSGTIAQSPAQGTALTLKAALKPAAMAAVVRKAPAQPRKAVTSLADLTGKGIMTYESLAEANGNGGNSVTLTAVGSDSLLITGFWLNNFPVKAYVNLAAKTVAIPSQYLYTHTSYGEMYLATCTSKAKPDYEVPITGKIGDDGKIYLNDWWGIFVKSGDHKDEFMYAGQNTVFEKSNANMHVDLADSTTHDWNVIVTQTSKNVVTVKNFGNHGKTVEIVLNPDSTLSINQQLVWEGGTTMGNFYTLAADWSTGKTTGNIITGRATHSTLSWGNWVMLSTTNYFTGQLLNATITGQSYSIPQVSSAGWQGSGTEADPWLIRTLDDLVLLADKVNGDTERHWGGPSVYYTKTFLGKYFALQNDIDMTGFRFTPIGNMWSQRFAGTFDGGGHTLKGLDINTGTVGYAGLFGSVDTAGVIKNLNLADATVRSAYYYTGGVAGFASASNISNCHVTGTISSDGVTTGGVVALGNNVSGCSFVGTIDGKGGIKGGIAGQVYGTIQDCWAKASISAAGTVATFTVGGIVGTLYNTGAQCLRSYFTGTVDGSQFSDLLVGGIAGQVFRGKVDRCFSVANVLALNDTQAAAGGVVGLLMGELTNSYATGYVQCTGSRRTGGITGWVRPYVLTQSVTPDTIQSSIKQCYFAGRLRAESYLYKRDIEVRETLGTIDDGTRPEVESVYFDKQMVDYTSTHYGAITSELTAAAGPKGFDGQVWNFSEGCYPRIKGIDDSELARLSASVLKLDDAFPDNANYVSENGKLNLLGTTVAKLSVGGKLQDVSPDFTITADSLKLNGSFGTDTLILYSTADQLITPRIITLKAAPRYFDGLGREDNPFLIKNKADLMKLGELTTNVGQYYSGAYFLQTADIDMQLDTTFVGICDALTDYTYQRFAGTYDGGGHTISRLALRFIDWKVAPTATTLGTPSTAKGSRSCIYKGLFGQLASEGVVKNLTLAADCQIELWGYAGGLVGYSYGLVENCRNYANIVAYSGTVGGIVGYLNPGAVVRGCLNAGNVTTGFTTAGGIAGSAAGGVIEQCQNVGTITARQLSTLAAASRTHLVGGIVGSIYGSSLRNVVNAGHVSGLKNAGGLAGAMTSTNVNIGGQNDIYQSVNYGTVFSSNPALTGSIGGSGYNPAATFENVYYDRQVTGLLAAAGDGMPGTTGVTTATLTGGKALDGLADSVWSFSAGQYPVLKRFAADEQVQAASRVVLTLDDRQTVRQLQTNGQLGQASGISWTLTQGTSFTADGTTLGVPATSTVASDTLVATLGDFVKPFALQAIAPVPLSGSGTEADPWQLHNPDEWNALAAYMTTTQNPLEGSFVKVMNDIDFTGATFTPLAGDGITPWSATLLGDGATIKGISYTTTAVSQGAIGLLGAAGTISHLTMQGTITTGKNYTGGFVGRMRGTLDNCVNEINMTSTAAYTGGFVGIADAGATLNRCVNKGTVTSTKPGAAGMVAQSTGAVTFVDCTNEGEVKLTAKANYAAGFLGSGKGGTTFIRCVNKGTITSKGSYVAGLQAYLQGGVPVTVTDCHNEAAITGVSSVAGLLGAQATTGIHTACVATGCYNTGDINASSSSTYGNAGLFSFVAGSSRITDCYNTGSVVAGPTALYTGGIWGYSVSTLKEQDSIVVKRCYNTGNILGVNYAAGIGCYLTSFTHVDSCYNIGEITANYGACGIGNVMRNYVTIDDCWNSGNITANKRGAGGIVGYGSYHSVATRCFNTGDVTVADGGGGLNAGGLGGQGRTVWINCYNRGAVTAPSMAGGLVGEPGWYATAPYYSTSFYNCYNAGRVATTNTATAGCLIGNTVKTNWNAAYNVISGTSYVTDWGTTTIDSIGGTPVSIAQLAKTTEMAGQWSYGDDYSFPVIGGYEQNDCARAFAAAVVLKDSDTYTNVAHSFWVGKPEGVTWSDDKGLVWFGDDNKAAANKASQDDDVLTATCGQYAAKWSVKFNTTSGVSETSLTEKPVLSRTRYNLAGVQITDPEPGQVFIEVIRYKDGTSISKKAVIK